MTSQPKRELIEYIRTAAESMTDSQRAQELKRQGCAFDLPPSTRFCVLMLQISIEDPEMEIPQTLALHRVGLNTTSPIFDLDAICSEMSTQELPLDFVRIMVLFIADPIHSVDVVLTLIQIGNNECCFVHSSLHKQLQVLSWASVEFLLRQMRTGTLNVQKTALETLAGWDPKNDDEECQDPTETYMDLNVAQQWWYAHITRVRWNKT